MNIGSPVVKTAVTVIVKMNLLGFESHKYLFCDLNLCLLLLLLFFFLEKAICLLSVYAPLY